MKKFIVAVVTSLALVTAFAEAETQKVCKDKTDKAGKAVLDKAGKPQQECKTIKIHKKLEATKVEDVKKK
jgi:hypothetical protein